MELKAKRGSDSHLGADRVVQCFNPACRRRTEPGVHFCDSCLNKMCHKKTQCFQDGSCQAGKRDLGQEQSLMADKDLLKPCWSCGEPGQKKEIGFPSNSTMAGIISNVVATCSNKDCEFSSFVFSFKAWNTRIKI